jgi:hypothetical protein
MIALSSRVDMGGIHVLVRSVGVAVAAGAVGMLGCSAGTVDHPSAATSVQYDIEFPSAEAAVSAETIQTFIFSTSTADTACPALLVARQSGQSLPMALAQTSPIPLCSLLGDGGTGGSLPGVAYGNVSFLVVAQRGGVDYFTGCTLATISSTSAPIAVQLQQVSTQHIPTTNCTTVGDHCANPPSCEVGDGGS